MISRATHRIGGLFAKTVSCISFGKVVPVSNSLNSYDVVVVGGGSAITFANQLQKVSGHDLKILVVNETSKNRNHNEGLLWELNKVPLSSLYYLTSFLLSKSIASILGTPVTHIHPQKNEIVVKNASIKYNILVLAPGNVENILSIPGMDQAWMNLNNQMNVCQDHPSYKAGAYKPYSIHRKFNGGEYVFYIPPGDPYGQINHYNFLFDKIKFNHMEKAGMFTWKNSRMTIILGSDSFHKYCPEFDAYIRKECKKLNIHIEENLELIKMNDGQSKAVFKHVKNGSIYEKPFNSFYSLMPTKTNPLISSSGLADSQGYLDVDQYTLKSKKFDNIYGLGDAANLPIPKTFLGAYRQACILRHNIGRKLCGLDEDVQYDGFSQDYMIPEIGQYVDLQTDYNGLISLDTDWPITKLNWLLNFKGMSQDMMSGKSHGPPFYYFGKTFPTVDYVKKPKHDHKEVAKVVTEK